MLGGGGTDKGEVGIADDSQWDVGVGGYLGGAGPVLFGQEHWGAEGEDGGDDDGRWGKGRVKSIWSGIMGLSADLVPWVGRLPPKLSGRHEPSLACFGRARPGEWIAGGYSGEGMVHAWLSGKAVGLMVLGKEEEERVCEWLPDCMRVGVQRWKKAKLDTTTLLGPI